MSTVLWIIGEPGIGKTTMVRALLPKPWELIDIKGWPKWTFAGPQKQIVAAGHYTGAMFDGADTVGYNQVNNAIAWWKEHLFTRPLTILDGDRFSHLKAVEAFQAAGADLRCFVLEGLGLAEERRGRRGSNQAASWLAGRRTKTTRFAKAFPGPTAQVYADQPPERLADQVKAFLGWWPVDEASGRG